MALINCPECGHEVSDTADVCPNCGYKLSMTKDIYTEGTSNTSETATLIKPNKKVIIIIAAIVILLIAVFILKNTREYRIANGIYLGMSEDEFVSICEKNDIELDKDDYNNYTTYYIEDGLEYFNVQDSSASIRAGFQDEDKKLEIIDIQGKGYTDTNEVVDKLGLKKSNNQNAYKESLGCIYNKLKLSKNTIVLVQYWEPYRGQGNVIYETVERSNNDGYND